MRAIVYYSYSGNTKSIVDIINNKLNIDVIKIDTIKPYSNNYDEVVDSAINETKENYQPEIISINIDKYDEIILCSPVWWYTVASPINTFIHEYKLNNKKIIPVITNGGWLGHTIDDIKNITKGNIENPLSLKFDGNKLVDTDKLNNWLNIIN